MSYLDVILICKSHLSAILDLIEDVGQTVVKILLRFSQRNCKFRLVVGSFSQIDSNGFRYVVFE